MIEFGSKYRDAVTGFEGIATARSEFMNGCVRVLLEAPDERGQPQEYWFDIQRLQHAGGKNEGRYVEEAEMVADLRHTGGPRPDAPRTGH